MLLGLSNLLPPPPPPPEAISSPLGSTAAHIRTGPTPMPRVSRDFESQLKHLLRQLGAGSGQEDVGQQEVPWHGRDTAVGVLRDMLKGRREGRESGEFGVVNLKPGAKQLVTSSTGIK